MEKDFEAADREVTFGRYITSTGDANFVAMSASTYGVPNAYPLVGPVVIASDDVYLYWLLSAFYLFNYEPS